VKRLSPAPALALLAVAGLSGPAAAGSRRPEPPLKLPAIKPAEAVYRQRLVSYAECLVKQPNAELAEFLNAGALSSDSAGKAKRLAKSLPGCAAPHGKFAAEPLLLRGAVFEGLYRRDFGSATVPADLASVAPARYGGRATSNSALATMLLGLFGIFDCVVRKDPRRVAEMLGHPPESEREGAVFEGLAAAFSECRPSPMRIEFRPSSARPYMSEIFYTLVRLSARPGPDVR
jgi:hypothetical protein